MHTHHVSTKHWLPALPSGFLFGACASLFNNIAVSFVFFLVNGFFALVLSKHLSPQFEAFWILDLTLLLLAAIVGSLGIWFGIRIAARLARWQRIHPDTRNLPLYGSIVLAAPIVFWTILQIVTDLTTVGVPAWRNLAYLVGQALIFSGVAYVLLLRYKYCCTLPRVALSPKVPTDVSTLMIFRTILIVIGAVAIIVTLHAGEAMMRLPYPILNVTDGFFSSDIAFVAVVKLIGLVAFAGAFLLGSCRRPSHLLKRLKKLAPWEYFLACFAVASGFTYATAYAAKINFIFSPYAVLPTTFAVLFGIAVSSLMYGNGRRDQLYVMLRVAAYVIGFASQPTILGSLVPLLDRIIS